MWKRLRLQVFVTNEVCIPSMGILKSMLLRVADDIFQADFYNIPLEEFDMVLGVK